jgi:hypothetical protein
MTSQFCRQKTNLEKSEKGRPHVRIGFQNLTQDVEWRHCGHHIQPEESKANGGEIFKQKLCFLLRTSQITVEFRVVSPTRFNQNLYFVALFFA